MEELIDQLSAGTNMSEEEAKCAAQIVINFLKARLSSPLVGQIDSLLNDTAPSSKVRTLGDLFG